MTFDELFDYVNLNDAFNKRCSEICQILKPLSPSYGYADTFEIYNDQVEFTGDEYWECGGHEEHSGEFPLKFIYTPNKEIEKYVSDKLAERERERKRINDVLELQKLKKEKAEYERLKKKFEGE